MKFGTALALMRHGKLKLGLRLQKLYKPYYRTCFLAGALRHGVLQKLSAGPVPFDTLAEDFAPDPAGRDALESWLRIGCLLGELQLGPAGYALKGFMARKLAEEIHDPIAAFVEEIVALHTRLIVEGPGRFHEGQPFTLADQDGEMIARSSRVLEPVVCEAVESVVPRQGAVRLLEVGCGSGVYLRHAIEQNPELTGVGFELQSVAAELARANLERWGLSGRVEVSVGDILEQEPDADHLFDLATLHNNIYYFPVADRVSLLRHLRRFLRPGGKLLLTTAAQGGQVSLEVLSLWAASTSGCGRLPGVEELVEQLREAGFEPEKPTSHVPGDAYYSFVGRVPS